MAFSRSWGALFVGVLVFRALLFGVHMKVPSSRGTPKSREGLGSDIIGFGLRGRLKLGATEAGGKGTFGDKFVPAKGAPC